MKSRSRVDEVVTVANCRVNRLISADDIMLLAILASSQHDLQNALKWDSSCVRPSRNLLRGLSHCLATLDCGAGVEQLFDCLIVQNGQPVQSIGKLMDWTFDDNMIDGLFFCATFTGRRRGHTPFVQAGAQTSDTGAEAVKPDPRCSWEGHTRRVGAGVGDESTESCGVVQPPRIPLVIRPERCTSVDIVSLTNDLLCGGYKWASRFEMPCIPTRWTGER